MAARQRRSRPRVIVVEGVFDPRYARAVPPETVEARAAELFAELLRARQARPAEGELAPVGTSATQHVTRQ